MSILKFSDGEQFDTSGPLRKEVRYDGWYVLGNGTMIPMKDEKAADNYLTDMRVKIIKESPDPRKEFLNQINKILKG